MKTKNLQRILFAFTLLFALTFLSPPMAHADTDGTEIQVLQPERLEIQLGTAWAGMEFQLRTDSGLYPDPIRVGEDGVLRLEIGGSNSYILSCMGLSNAIPMVEPENYGELATVGFPETTPEAAGSDIKETDPATPEVTEAPAEGTPVPAQETPHPVKTVAGSSVIYRSADGIYRDNPKHTMLYVCSRYPACDSYVRVHAGTRIPVGELANQPLRTLRRQAHHYFDQIYLSGLMSKQEAYLWLAQITCTPQSRAHIACMGEYNCRIIIEESRRLLEQQAIPYVALPELEVSQIET